MDVPSYTIISLGQTGYQRRPAISAGLSIAIVPLTVFYLNRFAGAPINFVNIIILIAVLTAMPLIILGRRKGKSI